jgi:hypothetical protein
MMNIMTNDSNRSLSLYLFLLGSVGDLG